MKLLAFSFIFSMTSVALATDMSGVWKVTGAECWFEHRRSTCDEQTPQKVEISFTETGSVTFSTSTGIKKTIPLKTYGKFPDVSPNGTSAMFYYTDDEIRYEEVGFNDWKLNDTWIFGKPIGEQQLYIDFGQHLTFPNALDKIYYLTLSR